jgi:hypothetical protein
VKESGLVGGYQVRVEPAVWCPEDRGSKFLRNIGNQHYEDYGPLGLIRLFGLID